MKVTNWTEAIVFIVYLVFMIGVGLFFFLRSKGAGEKEYFLGGRKMGPWVSALSAGASDMSAWVLMGLPTAIYAKGLGQVWIAVGLAIGYALSWLFEAKRLRAFSIVSDDAITIPQYLTRRFKSKSYALQVVCAVIFLIALRYSALSEISSAIMSSAPAIAESASGTPSSSLINSAADSAIEGEYDARCSKIRAASGSSPLSFATEARVFLFGRNGR